MTLDRILEVAVGTASADELDRLDAALAELTLHDRSVSFASDRESNQVVVSGTTKESVLDTIELLKRAIGPGLRFGALQVAYRETLSRPASIKYTHKKQIGGSGEFAEVTIHFEPLPSGSGYVFENAIANRFLPLDFVAAVDNALRAQKETGLLAGFPVTDFKAILTDGKYHEVDSNAVTFDIAARAAFRKLTSEGVVSLLEPIMEIEVAVPEKYRGAVVADLTSRRGKSISADILGDSRSKVTAKVPLADILNYDLALRTLSEGSATYSAKFTHYDQLPGSFEPDPKFPGAMSMRVA